MEEVQYVFNIPDDGLQDREYTLKISDENTDKKLFKINGRNFSPDDGYVSGYPVRFVWPRDHQRGFEVVQDDIDEEERRTIKLKIEPDIGEMGNEVLDDIPDEEMGLEINDSSGIYSDLQRLIDEEIPATLNAGRGPERELLGMLDGGGTGRNKKHKSHRRKSHNKSKKKKSKKKRFRKKSKKR